jgi:hypothetical protein
MKGSVRYEPQMRAYTLVHNSQLLSQTCSTEIRKYVRSRQRSFESRITDVRVYLRRHDAGVTKKSLHDSNIGARLDQRRSRRMAKHVRRKAPRYSHVLCHPVQLASDLSRRQSRVISKEECSAGSTPYNLL